jgi:hypothetical protein
VASSTPATIGSGAITITVGLGKSSNTAGTASSIVQGSTTIATAAGGATNQRSGSGSGTGTTSSFSGTSAVYGAHGGATGNSGGTNAGTGATVGCGGCGGTSATNGYGGGGGAGGGGDGGGFTLYTAAGSGGNGVVMIRYTAFAVSAFTTSTASPTASTTLTYSITFTGPVDTSTFTGDDLTFAGATGCSASIVPVSPSSGAATTFTVTVTGCSDGAVVPTLTAGSVTASTGVVGPGASASGPSVTVDRTPPATPPAVDLAAGSDSGSSSSDDVTSSMTLTLSAGGSNGDTITITATDGNTTLTCSYVYSGGSTTSCPLGGFVAGTWTATATAADALGNTSAAGPPTTVVIDTTAPAAPGAVDLLASSDLGTSSTDDRTSDATPAMGVSQGASGDVVTVRATDGMTTRSCTYVVGSASSCDLPTLSDGTWSVTATLTDPAGNESSAGPAMTMVIDATAPATASTAPDLATASDSGSSSTDDRTSDVTPTFSRIGAAADGDVVTVRATDGTTTVTCAYTIGDATSCDLPTLTDGTWSVTSTLTDSAGNVSGASSATTLVVDTTAPSAPSPVDVAAASDSGSSSTDDRTSDATPTVSASVSGAATGDVVTVVASDGTTTRTCTYVVGSVPASCDLPTLSDGTWSVTATHTDAAGNTSPPSTPIALVIDTTAPDLTTVDLLATSDTGVSSTDDTTSDTTPAISVPGQGPGDVVTVTATDGTTTLQCTYTVGAATSCDLPALTSGTWSVTAMVVDAAGNSAATSGPRTITVDTVAPPSPTAPDLAAASDTGPSSADDVTGDATPAFGGSTGDVGDVVTISATDGSTTRTCTYEIGAASACDLPPLTDGTWSVTATRTDAAGNASSPSPPILVTIDATPPPTPIGLDLAASSDSGRSDDDDITNDPSPRVGVGGLVPGDTVTITATDGVAERSCTFVATDTTGSCQILGLADGAWSVTATSTDPLGNRSTPTSPALDLMIDTTAPTIPGRVDLAPPSDTGRADDDDLTSDTAPVVRAGGGVGDVVTITATDGTTTVRCSYTVVDPTSGCRLATLADGVWLITGEVVDPAGNRAVPLDVLTITVDTAPPSARPVVVADPGPGRIDVRVDGVEPGLEVAVEGTDGRRARACGFTVTAERRSCTLDALDPGAWRITATAADAAGNRTPASEALEVIVASSPVGAASGTAASGLGADGRRDGGDDGPAPVGDLGSDDALRLLAAGLAIAAGARRRPDGGLRRLDDDERETSDVGGFVVGSGDRGLDARSDLFTPPVWARLDDAMRAAVRRVAPLSPVLGRAFDDGAYVRALLGVFWPVLPVAGAITGVLAALDSRPVVALPGLGFVVALVVIGCLDATAGIAAAVAYATVAAATGALDGPDALRGMFGIAVLTFAVASVASGMRPFRRADGRHAGWNRFVDAVHIPLFGAWTAGTMVACIPHLSGYASPTMERLGVVELAALGTLVVRYAVENVARVSVAERLSAVEVGELPEPSAVQRHLSALVRSALFVFVAAVFIEARWALWLGGAMFLVPKLVEQFAERFPNFGEAYRWVPRNHFRIVAMFFVMLWWGIALADAVEGPDGVARGFVLMSVPGLLLGGLDWFVRDGSRWPSNALSRLLGLATFLFGVALVRGLVL